MTTRTWIRNLFARPVSRPIRTSLARRRLAVEALEAREVPAVLFVDDSAAGDNNGHDWANAFTDLQPALTAAQSGDQIWVAEGTYSPTSTADRTVSFVMKEGVGVYGGFAGSETALWQRNWRDHATTLSGDIGNPGDNSDNSYHVVYANNLTVASTLDGFTVTGGNANGSDPLGQNKGGGLFDSGSALAVSNMIFTGNSSTNDGGGIFNQFDSLVLTNVIFTGNTAASGGGMNNIGGTPTLINVVFTGNSANQGGGLFNDHSDVTLFNVTFSGNTASQAGGGLFSSGGSVTVSNSILWGNTSGNQPEFGEQAGAVTRISNSNVQGGAPGSGNIHADPLFVDAANGDFRLRAGSPAIDAGTNTHAPAFDLDGQSRPRDGKGLGVAITDMGAYEAKASPTFSALLSPTIDNGTATTTLSGHLAVGSIHPPAGAVVSITLNGVTQAATLDAEGNFGTTFNIAALTPANYVVTYSYDGDSDFNPAAGGSLLSILAGASATLDGNTVVITGSADNDVIQLNRKGGTLSVSASFLPTAQSFRAADVKNVRFVLGDGDDVASVASNVRLPVFMDGGAGNDVLAGGSGNDVLMGGAGDDMVWGGSGHDMLVGGSGRDGLYGELGRDVLIGGLDIDMLQGGHGQDLLLGGSTAVDEDPTALGAVRSEWTSGRTYAARIRNLTEGSARRLNGNTFLNATTVIDDGQADVLGGGLGRDWFWSGTSAVMLDRATNERSQVVA